MDKDYSKREIDTYFKDVSENFEVVHDTLKQIKDQTTMTNGKVAELQKWRERWTGASWAIGIVATVIIIPLASWLFITVSKIDSKIDKSIKNALSEYDITIEE